MPFMSLKVIRPFSSLILILIVSFIWLISNTQAANTTYFVSSSSGSDSNNGLAEDAAFATIAHVNSLDLQPGDEVLFKCGDTWRAESLVITKSGTAENRLTFGSYPSSCTDKPIFSGTRPISGWSQYLGDIYMAQLNAGEFPEGINQLFGDNQRLPMGRWPNIDSNNDGGYSIIDGHSDSNLTDNELPDVDWTGARVHIKGMRWYILNRAVAGRNGTTLSLNAFPDCWGNDCTGWGYFINNHLATLDQDGEWFFDEATNRVYLVSPSGPPANIEGSVVIPDADIGFHGGIIIGRHLQEAAHYVTIENMAIEGWFDNGITTPRNQESEDSSYVTIRDVDVVNVDKAGMFFTTWIWNAGSDSGWRGGRNLLVENSLISGANHTGLNSYAINSTFRGNTLRDIALIENLGKDGMGCTIEQGGGFCTRDGMGMRFPVDKPEFSGFGNTIEQNRFEKTGSSGIQMFGRENTVRQNVLIETAYAKGDNGGIAVFGGNGFGDTNARDITIQQNIVISATGNTDGALSTYDPLFAVGIYIDHYADNITVADNTVIGSTIDGILFQNSRGSVTGNTLYNNNFGSMSRGQIGIYNNSQLSNMSENILYALKRTDDFTFAKTLHTESADGSNISAADNNFYFNPYRPDHISPGFNLQTLAEWQASSGLDGNSTTGWFSLAPEEAPLSKIFYNDTPVSKTIDLGDRKYLDLEQNEVTGSITLAPFTSQILIDSGEVALSAERLVFDNASSPAQTVEFKNITGGPLTITSVVASTGFSQTNDCPAVLPANATCTITVSFTPVSSGPELGTLMVNHSGSEPYTVELAGGLEKVFLPLVVR
ncbi:MAG: hypothetical protein AB8G95_13480 [Anaerolineae bacterium]